MSASQRRDLRDGLLFTSPFIFGVVALWVGPMLYSLYLILHKWNMLVPPKFIGLGNFERMLNDPLVGKSLINTAYYTFVGVPLQLLVAFALAMMLNQQIRGLGIYRTIYYLPSITPVVAFAVVWIQILNPEFGVLNEVLGWFGLGACQLAVPAGLGQTGADHYEPVADRLPDDYLSGRSARGAYRVARGRRDRWRQRLAPLH